jgi:hypothetical protein
VSRYDKYDPYNGGTRARLAADWPRADAIAGVPYGVGLDANGRVVKGAGVSGIIGVLILTQNAANPGDVHRAGDVVDIMDLGEIVEWKTTAGVAGVAATNYYATHTTGAIVVGTGGGGRTAPAGTSIIGHTVEGSRLKCRVPLNATAAA